jgi:nickel superoxide dismutase
MKKLFGILFVLIVLSILSTSVYAHCQIPCGIYGDQTRFTLLREHITTIEKSMKQITTLSKDASVNMNQLVRWVSNKDQHADEFTDIVTYYFLAQRIKIADEGNVSEFADYQKKVTVLHQMMVYSMKCKQTTDLENVKKLSTLVDQFEAMYFTEADKRHLKQHKK